MAAPSRKVISPTIYTKIVSGDANYLVQNTESVTLSIIGNLTDILPSPSDIGYLVEPTKGISNAELIDRATGTVCTYVYAKVINGVENTTYTLSV